MQQQPGQNMAQTPIPAIPVQGPVLAGKQQQQQQPQSGHTTFHHLNHQKTFNVVSLLKSTTATHTLSSQQKQQQQQQLHHHQSQQQGPPHPQTYNNILNRANTPSGSTASASSPNQQAQSIICQISAPEGPATSNVYALNPRIVNNLNIDANGTANSSGGIVGLNVSCVDNRKYEYKNKLLNNNFQTAQEYNQTTGSSLGTGGTGVRGNQPTASIYRGPAPSSVPRNNAGTRHMPNNVSLQTMYQQTMPQSMIMQNFQPYQPRQPSAFQPHQFTFQQTLPHHYYPIQYFHTAPLQQAQTHQRNAVGVTTNAGVGNAMSAGPNGPLSGPATGPTQAPVPLAAGTVISSSVPPLSIANTSTAAQVGVGVGVSPMVAVVPPVPTQQTAPVSRKRTHAIPIINPFTNRNILEDIEISKRSSNSESDYADAVPVPASVPVTMQPETSLPYTLEQQKPEFSSISTISNVIVMSPADTTTSRTNSIQHTSNIDLHHIPQHREIGQIGQTPVVSAMSDAPSVEILPSQPKARSKKIPIVAPKDEVSQNPKVDEQKDVSQNNEALTAESELKTSQQQQKPEAQMQQEDTKEISNNATITTESSTTLLTTSAILKNVETEKCRNIQQENESQPEIESKNLAVVMQTPVAVHQTESTKSSIDDTMAKPSSIEENVDDSTGNGKVFIEINRSGQLNKTENSTIKNKNDEQSQLKQEENSINSKIVTNNNNVEENSTTNNDIQSKCTENRDTLKTTEICDETDRALITETKAPIQVESQKSLEKTTEQDVMETAAPSATKVKVEEASKTHADQVDENSQTSISAHTETLIQYNDGQWSPHNPSGKKQYDRDQLLQLREAKASRLQPEVSNPAILPQCNMMPTFARISGTNKRMHSMGGMGSGGGGHRGGDGGGSGSYGSKQSSMSGVNARGSSKGAMILVNLSLNQDVKLNETDNAWKPRVFQKSASEVQEDSEKETEDLLRRVRGILNKLTPEKFDALIEEIIKLKIDTREKMEAVMILVFEKAVDEPNFSVSYARLCNRLINEVKARDERMEQGTKSNLASFRNALLDKTEREFTTNVTQNTAKQTKLQPIIENIKTCTDPAEKAELEVQLEEEELKMRRRSTGTVRFIGELFKSAMLTGKIIYSCVEQLLNPQSEDMLECLCKLLTTVGAKLEQTPLNAKDPTRLYSLEKVIARMQAIASKSDKESAKISSRVRFMLQDVIDLRKNKWQSKRNEAPKTMGQIEKETKSEQMSSQFMNYSGSISTGPTSGVGSGGHGGGLSGHGGGAGGKRGGDDRGSGRYNDHRSGGGYSGSHSQRGGDSGRRQNLGSNTGNSGGNGNSGGSADDTWHVQTARGRSLYVDHNKLEGLMNINQDIGTKKMGGMAQFLWNTNSRTTATSSSGSASMGTPSNSFAALSSLDDRGSDRDRDNDRDRNRDRDRSGPRNKGSYSKNSMERERRDYWNDRSIRSRTGSSQVSRENSSSRSGQQGGGVRGMNVPSAVSKSASHSSSKYTQPPLSSTTSTSRMAGKPTAGLAVQDASQKVNDSQSNSTPPPVTFEEPTDADIKLIKSVINEMIESVITSGLSSKSVAEAANCFERIRSNQKCGFLYYILTDYLHTRHVGPSYRRYLGIIVCYLIEHKHILMEHLMIAYEQFADLASELLVDIPELWSYIFQFTGPLIAKKIITVYDLWTERLKNDESSNLGKRFLKAFLNYCTREIGPSFTRNMWTKQQMKWSDFMSENEVENFIKTNNFEYIENDSLKPCIDVRNEKREAHINQVVEHIKHLLQEDANADSIIDYINGNIVDIDKQFIRQLTTTLCNFSIIYQDESYKLNSALFHKVCVPLLQRYIEVVEEREFECLYAMQLLVHEMEHPRGLLCELFAQLYEGDVISSESFVNWRNSKDQSAGKGVAVKGLNSFFNQLLKEETSDENN